MKKIYLFILLLLSILFLFPITEGLATKSPLIGEFDYLAPIPSSNVWSQDTIDKFISKFNSVNELPDANMIKPDTLPDSGFLQLALEKEAMYYNDNGNWPINRYVTDYINNQNPKHPIFGQPIPGRSGKVYSLETLSALWPNRLIYQTFIYTTEMQMTELPLSYKIFKGIIPPPPSNIPTVGIITQPSTPSPTFDTSKLTDGTTSSTNTDGSSKMPSFDTSSGSFGTSE
jgi:hypothetical protein